MEIQKDIAIAVDQLNFAYSGNSPLFNGLSLEVPRGSVYGLLGANGAGKSTLMKLMVGLLRPASGTTEVMGAPLCRSVFRNIGLLIESPNLYPHLSAWDNLRAMAIYRGVRQSRITEVLELVGLEGTADKQVRHFSTGMKQRLGIALALLHRPRLLLLDEPVNGLDPVGIVAIRGLIRKLNREAGITILLSSHLLSEVEQSCTHLAVLARGKMAYQGTLEGLRRSSSHALRLRLECSPAALALKMLKDKGYEVVPGDKGGIEVLLSDKKGISAMIDLLREAGVEIYQLFIQEDKLEDFFLNLYQQ